MKLQIMSDLHLEMHADRGAEFIRELDPTGVDVLVLAGDITMRRDYEDLATVFEPFARKYRKILYVPGNHEYYRSSPKQVTRNLAKLTKDIPAVVMPDNGAVVIAGHRFVAGTMWFRPDPMGDLNKRLMHDFSLIQDFEPWVYDQNAAFEKALVTRTEPGDVVVTHHMPATESVPPRFARSAMNAFFVCDMTSHLRELKPKLWIHGHTTAAPTCSARPGSWPTRSGIRTRSEASKRSTLRFKSTSEDRAGGATSPACVCQPVVTTAGFWVRLPGAGGCCHECCQVTPIVDRILKSPGKSPKKTVLSACCQTDRISSVRAGFKRRETPEANLVKTRRFGRKSA